MHANVLPTPHLFSAPIHPTQADLLPGFALTLSTICLWMKLVSYAHCHADLRAAHRQVKLGAAAFARLIDLLAQ